MLLSPFAAVLGTLKMTTLLDYMKLFIYIHIIHILPMHYQSMMCVGTAYTFRVFVYLVSFVPWRGNSLPFHLGTVLCVFHNSFDGSYRFSLGGGPQQDDV